jgi:hypothetical protein
MIITLSGPATEKMLLPALESFTSHAMTALQSEEIFFVRPMEIVNTHRTHSNRSGGEASGFMEQTNNPGFFLLFLWLSPPFGPAHLLTEPRDECGGSKRLHT